MIKSWTDEYVQAMSATLPLHRVGEPDEMAGVVLWLASAASSFVKGHVFAVDGGLSA